MTELNFTVTNSITFTSATHTIQSMYPDFLVVGLGKFKSFKEAREAIIASLEN